MLKISLDVLVMLFGAQGWKIEGCTNMTVTSLGYTRFFVNTLTGVESPWVKTRKLHPFPMGKVWRQQQELAHERNGTGIANAFDADQQGQNPLKFGMFAYQDQCPSC